MARPRGTWGDKAFRDALNKAVRQRHEDGRQKLEHIAEKLVAEAVIGDMSAISEVANRLDGRPHQTAEIANIHEHYVVEVPALKQTTAEEWGKRYDA
jgi:hypothetical protein